MRKFAFELLVVIAVLVGAADEGRADSLGMHPGQFPSVFNKQAEFLGLGMRAMIKSCKKGMRYVCRYEMYLDHLEAMGASEDAIALMDDFMLIFVRSDGSEKSAEEAIVAWSVVLGIFSPAVSERERGTIVLEMIEELKRDDLVQRKIGNIRYTMNNALGTALIVRRAEIDFRIKAP